MPPPDGYYSALNWWWCTQTNDAMPTRSIFPDQMGGPRWEVGDVPAPGGARRRAQVASVQGWKLHVCCMPDDISELFYAISPTLRELNVAHKFYPFTDFAHAKTGHAAWQAAQNSADSGKACAIYPRDPAELKNVVQRVEQALHQALHLGAAAAATRAGRRAGTRTIRPFPGGVKGDMQLGFTGFVYCRYGGFSGPLADANMLYDNINGQTVHEQRYAKAFPDFIQCVPAELASLRRIGN